QNDNRQSALIRDNFFLLRHVHNKNSLAVIARLFNSPGLPHSYSMKGMVGLAKRPIKGKTAVRSVEDKPYHVASVAAYCSTEVVGIQRPRGLEPPSVSSGPPNANVGYVPYNAFPRTFPPTIK